MSTPDQSHQTTVEYPQSDRSYNGLAAAERASQRRRRLLEVGLDMLGDPDGPQDLTLRTVCRRSGLAQRYFYESFADKDQFAAAIYDWALEGLVAGAQFAVAGVPPNDQARAGITSLVRAISADRRIGQLLFSPNQISLVLVRKRFESTAMFVSLFAQHLRDTFHPNNERGLPVLAQFLVGGMGQTLAAWLNNEMSIAEDDLIEQLIAIFTLHGPRI
ncbi:MAG: TetR/AcrR family transcriptional regulator [Mycobacterium sp.]